MDFIGYMGGLGISSDGGEIGQWCWGSMVGLELGCAAGGAPGGGQAGGDYR